MFIICFWSFNGVDMKTITNFSKTVTELIKEISHNRYKIREDFFRAYLAEQKIVDIKDIEMVEELSKDGLSISWFFREKKK